MHSHPPCRGVQDDDAHASDNDFYSSSNSDDISDEFNLNSNNDCHGMGNFDLEFSSGGSYHSSDDSTYDPHKDMESREPIIFTEQVIEDWIEVFENILIFYGWLTSDKLPCAIFKHGTLSIAEYCTQSFMKQFQDVAYRYEGMGLKLTKFHQLHHWYFYISMYGEKSNLGEKRRQTNGLHSKKFLRGSKFSINFNYAGQDQQNLGNKPGLNPCQVSMVEIFGMMPESTFKWSHKRNHNKSSFPPITFETIVRKIAWFNNGDATKRIISIDGHTELRIPTSSGNNINRDIIRAHPDYKNNGLWLDWIDVIWESDDIQKEDVMILPAQVVMILDFDSAEYEYIPKEIVNKVPILITGSDEVVHNHREGIHLLVHSADHNNVKEEEDQAGLSITQRFVMEPFFQLIEMSNVNGIAFVARDPPSRENQDDINFGISYVRNPHIWGNAFVPRLSEGYKYPNDDQLSLDEFNEIYNPW